MTFAKALVSLARRAACLTSRLQVFTSPFPIPIICHHRSHLEHHPPFPTLPPPTPSSSTPRREPRSVIMSYEADTYDQRDSGRDRSPRRRSRSPRRSRRSYSPRSRSRSRDDYRRSDRRSRSPVSGAQGTGGYQSYGAGRGGSSRADGAKEPGMQSVRENSQQDRRVYVGNLSYDVKWHHLKDFMRQGMGSDVVTRGWQARTDLE